MTQRGVLGQCWERRQQISRQCECDRPTDTEFRHSNTNDFPRGGMAAEQRMTPRTSLRIQEQSKPWRREQSAVSSVLHQDSLLLKYIVF